jgi:TetR/AcrR family transcriptional regulator
MGQPRLTCQTGSSCGSGLQIINQGINFRQAMASRPPTSGTPRPRRTPGRPTRDSADQRAHLLDAALECFVSRGVGATSLRAIATQAHVTPALLHYYFGDKEQLLAAIVEERLMPALALVRASVAEAGEDVGALIAGFIHGMGETIERHPWLPALWVREVLCEGGALRDVMFSRVAPQLPVILAARFARAQAQGRLNPALDPRLLVISLVGLTLFPAAGAPIWRRVFDAADIDGPALGAHALVLLEAGLGLRLASQDHSPGFRE